MLTQEILQSFVHYDPETGTMIRSRKTGPSGHPGDEIGHISSHCGGLQYRKFEYKHREYQVHRAAWLYMTGEWPKGDIDHINGNGLDNRWCNLRLVDMSTNQRNRKLNKNNTSGCVGVSWHYQTGKWVAKINASVGKKKTIGYFDEFNAAVAARKAAEIEYGYHPNHGRKAA